QGRRDRFDIARVLERLVEKGKIVAKKAYADWSRFANYTSPLHEAAIELIEIPRRAQSGKNSADIRLCVDAMDLAYAKSHIDTFVVVSGDSDFSPLVSKLKELGKHVIGLGMTESTSDLLRDNCDEFIYYEDLGPEMTAAPPAESEEQKAKKSRRRRRPVSGRTGPEDRGQVVKKRRAPAAPGAPKPAAAPAERPPTPPEEPPPPPPPPVPPTKAI